MGEDDAIGADSGRVIGRKVFPAAGLCVLGDIDGCFGVEAASIESKFDEVLIQSTMVHGGDMEASGIRVWGDIKVLTQDGGLVDGDPDGPLARLGSGVKSGDRHLGQEAERRGCGKLRVGGGERDDALWVEPLDGQAVAGLNLLGYKP